MEQALLPMDDELAVEEIDGRDEMNLAEFPLFSLKRRIPADQKTLSYETDFEDRRTGKTGRRKFQITAGDAYGLPTARDGDVLMALLYFAKEQNKLENQTVHFSRYEMAQLLGWGDGGSTYRDIQAALFKWLGVTLEYQKGWWDHGDKRMKTIGFHVLESVEINDSAGRTPQAELPFSSVRFSDEFFRSLTNGYVKKLNLAELFSFTVPAAKQMYRFLDKRFYHKKRLEFDLREFACERIGFSRNYKPSKLKAKLKPALEELEAIGFILAAHPEQRYLAGNTRGKWKIVFEREERNTLSKPLTGSREERTVNRALVKLLTDRKVAPAKAHELVEDKSISEEQIRFAVEHLDFLLDVYPEKSPKQRGGWLVKAIKEAYEPPSDFVSKADRQRISKEETAKQKQREKQQQVKEKKRRQADAAAAEKWSEEVRQVDAYLARISKRERETCIEGAIAGKDPMKLARKYRANPEPDSMAETAYYQLLIAHVLPLLERVEVA